MQDHYVNIDILLEMNFLEADSVNSNGPASAAPERRTYSR